MIKFTDKDRPSTAGLLPAVGDLRVAENANAVMLDGMTITEAKHRYDITNPESTAINDKQSDGFVNSISVAEHNTKSFDAVGLDPLTPYRVFVDAMTAVKSEKTTIEVDAFTKNPITGAWEKGTKKVQVYRDVPDWEMRLKAARTVIYLKGHDPGKRYNIDVSKDGTPTEDTVKAYLVVANETQDERALLAYQQLRNRLRESRGMKVVSSVEK